MRSYSARSKQRGFWEYVIPAVASVVGGWLSKKGQEDSNEANAQLAQNQMQFQADMSNTSYQRVIGDMEAAGLNPMLAYSQGGASTPGGASAVMQNELGAGVSGAQQGMAMMQGMSGVLQSGAQSELLKAQAEKVRSETIEHNINAARAQSELYRSQEDAANAAINFQRNREVWLAEQAPPGGTSAFSADVSRRKAEAVLTQQEIPRSKAEADFWRSDFGEASPWIKGIMQLLRGASSARDVLRR